MKHGIFCKNGLFIKKVNQFDCVQKVLDATLACLCEQALSLGLSYLWVTRDTGVIPDEAFVNAAREQWSVSATYRYPEGSKLPAGKRNEAISITASQKDAGVDRQHVTIVFPYNTKWNFGATNNPTYLLGTIAYLEKALKVRIAASPAKIGWKLVDLLNEGQLDAKIPRAADLAACHFDQHAAQDIIWQRSLSTHELQKHYLHKYRKHTAYLYECLQQEFGLGEPIHMSGTEYNQSYPGVWRISVQEKMLRNLPPVLWEGAEWVAAPIVKFLYDLGEEVTVHEGWVYPIIKGKAQYQPWLQSWAQFIWQKWQSFKDESQWGHNACREYAEWSMKDIVLATVGLGVLNQSQSSVAYKHPEVKVQVVGAARASLLGNILDIQREQLLKPVLVYKDTLYYLSNNPDAHQALSGVFTKEEAPGDFNHEWTLPMTKPVGEILMMDTTPYEKQSMLQLFMHKRQREKLR
ncbi:hypothetical protein KDA_58350 [Dictyobacter alpinus]|uniref:Uncharacterized protein n=1 Tax=Dictyobacter alpinus TaxID=2014873 RepID=A0A402BG05_9CHLR|nr:hypothetical protein [Dictyobacter alpinus]GCE30319.1 hypothetical protein KDA_58030 [Dictyobacter alpinus]GCE30351.1 hypothetical protein KDA_58350 [Dictyobacter alpinus]